MDSLTNSLQLVKEMLEDNHLTESERRIVKKMMLYVDLSITNTCNHSDKIVEDAVGKIKIQLQESNEGRSKVLNDIFEKLRGIDGSIIKLTELTEAQGKEINKIKKVAGINGGSN